MKTLLNGGVLAAIAAMSLAACGGGGGSYSPPAPNPTQAGAPTPAPSGTPSPSPTPTASPTPTPTPTPTLITTADYSVVGTFLCWDKPSGGSGFNLYFGYENKNDVNVTIKRGSTDANNPAINLNTMSIVSTETGTSVSSAQPEIFVAGNHTTATDPNTFFVSVPGETTASWELDGNPPVVGSTSGTKCGSGSGA